MGGGVEGAGGSSGVACRWASVSAGAGEVDAGDASKVRR
jgi:hypothetical protein